MPFEFKRLWFDFRQYVTVYRQNMDRQQKRNFGNILTFS